MVDEVWLHIGTAKSGTSSLQKHFHMQADWLSAQGVAYITTDKRRATVNELAISHNKSRDDAPVLQARVNQQIEERPERIGFLSSEMFFGFPPETVFDLLPSLRTRKLTVLVYLRRQDRYIEAVYLQKTKNVRFTGSIGAYVRRFKGSGSDYHKALSLWEATDATLVPRVMERARLVGGSVVSDALAALGLPPDGITEAAKDNVSPGLHRVQLLQAAAEANIADPRALQRRLAKLFPQDPKDRAPILNRAQRRAYLDVFAAGNEALRARYFPDQPTLFDESDFAAPDRPQGIRLFTQDQQAEIVRLLKAIKEVV